MRNKILSRRILKFKKRGEKEQKKKREILNFTYHKELSSPPQKKNYTLLSVRASHISCTPLLYANPNLNLTRARRESFDKTVAGVTRGIFLEQLPAFRRNRPFSTRQIVGLSFAFSHHARVVDLKNSIRLWRRSLSYRGFGKQEGVGGGEVRDKKWGTEMGTGRVGRVAKNEEKIGL